MLRFFVVVLLVFAFLNDGFTQSGRKITPDLTPVKDESRIHENGYSESKPNKSRTSNRFTMLRKTGSIETPDLTKKDPKLNNSTELISNDDVLTIETNLVTIPVSVFDRNGIYIPNIKQEEVKIFEDDKEQKIAYFATSDKPITVVLLLDTSPSTEYKIEEIQNAAIAFVNQLKAHDTVMVIEFDENMHVLTKPTKDRKKIYKAIWDADFGGGTSLYDAVDYTLKKWLNKLDGRKAIVLFTDGVDTTSDKAGYDSSLREAEEADALIFPIYYNTFKENRRSTIINSPFPFPGGTVYSRSGTSARDYALGKQYLEELGESTGGRVFEADSTAGGLTAAFKGIAEELRRQYSIGYYPEDEGQAGQRKFIRVRVNRPNLIIRARDSYIVGRSSSKTPPSQP